MTKKILIVLAIVMLAGGAAVTALSLTKERHSFFNENLEALMAGEGVSGVIECDGEGQLYCPLTNTNVFGEIRIYQ
jgi:hypothetical protein